MYLTYNLFDEIFNKPYWNQGLRKLRILSGYASSSFLFHVLKKLPEVEIELIIGMAKKDGIQVWDHKEYMRLTEETNRVKVYYYIDSPGNHSKIYHWSSTSLSIDNISFVGSANFSWNGFRDQSELMVESSSNEIHSIFNKINKIECITENVEHEIKINTVRTFLRLEQVNRNTERYYSTGIRPNYEWYDSIDLPLFIQNHETIHEKSGLNWGQRSGREPNQAYIPVPNSFNRDNPNFFPPHKEEFNMLTDDGEEFICVMAQENRKAIETSRSNSILGKYFRKRLNVSFGVKVELDHLDNYGRRFVTIYKVDNETYFMDFSPLRKFH